MVHFESFDNIDEMFARMDEATNAANAAATPDQKAITYGDYFLRYIPEYDLMIFGHILTEQEIYSSSAYDGVSAEEIRYEQKNMQRNYERGYRFCRAYSVVVPEGELGDTHVVSMIPITKENFEEAKAANWDLEEIRFQPWFIRLILSQVEGG